MSTKVYFTDEKTVCAETNSGENYIITFLGSMNYQIDESFDHYVTKLLEGAFDRYYDGTINSIWDAVNRCLYQNNCNGIFSIGLDKNQERERIGAKIRKIREEKKIDAKTLAAKAGIDAANLCRIEQGRYSTGFDVLSKIATALGMKVDIVEL